jgi:hypothetical protein
MAAESLLNNITDFHDVVRLLEGHPEWLAELRRLVLTNDLLALPEQTAQTTRQIAALAEAQIRGDMRLTELVEAQRHTDEQLATLIRQVTVLTEMTQALTKEVSTLKTDVRTLTTDMGDLKGEGLETRYRLHGSPFFGVVINGPTVLSMADLTNLLDQATNQGTLSEADAMELRRADAVVRGTRKGKGTPVYLVVEVSWTVDTDDVERAARRASLLAKTGVSVLPVVAGKTVRPKAARLSQAWHVWQLTDADVVAPEEP